MNEKIEIRKAIEEADEYAAGYTKKYGTNPVIIFRSHLAYLINDRGLRVSQEMLRRICGVYSQKLTDTHYIDIMSAL